MIINIFTFGLFMNCDKMAGGFFKKGLDAIKSIMELASQKQPGLQPSA